MYKYIIFLFVFMFTINAYAYDILRDDNCTIGYTFMGDGSVKLYDINGTCEFEAYNYTQRIFTHKYIKEKNKREDTYLCIFCPLTKICINNKCVEYGE